MAILVEAFQWCLILAGSFFLLVGAFGMARMPDVFTRMHSASVSDTLGAGFLILGMALESGFSLVTVKLAIILILFVLTGPLATHALSRAALVVGVQPLLADENGALAPRAVEVGPISAGGQLWEQEQEQKQRRDGAGEEIFASQAGTAAAVAGDHTKDANE